MTTGLTSRVAVVGLGYVGLPLATAFRKGLPTIGFDINRSRIALVSVKDLTRLEVRVVTEILAGEEKYDAVILAAPHRMFREQCTEAYANPLANGEGRWFSSILKVFPVGWGVIRACCFGGFSEYHAA